MCRGPVGHQLLGAFKIIISMDASLEHRLNKRWCIHQITTLDLSRPCYAAHHRWLEVDMHQILQQQILWCSSSVHWEMIIYNNLHVKKVCNGVRNV
jgi:hypothetical protein